MAVVCCVCVFFSSRRRHTRLQGDWSSDVCTSDLYGISHKNCLTKGLHIAYAANQVKRFTRLVGLRIPPQGKGVVSMTTFVRHIPIVLAVALILQFFAPPAAAQYNAGLQGTVIDPNGGVVPEAKG